MIIDYSTKQLNKQNHILSGDSIEIIEDENSKIFILSDGLGSGVKANISSTYTKIVLSKFLQNNIELEKTIRVLKNILPTCQERGFAYATFTIVQIFKDLTVKIIEYDNPTVFYFRDKKIKNYEKKEFKIEDKKVYISEFKLKKTDSLVIASDGLIHAGRGRLIRNGWSWEKIAEFIEKNITLPAYMLCESLIFYAQMVENKKIQDDISVITIQIRDKITLNIAIGPPESKQKDKVFVEDFCKQNGKKIICGGTTSQLFSEILKEKLEIEQTQQLNDIPAKYFLKGIDLATEGHLTLQKVLKWIDFTKEYVYEYKKIDSLHSLKNIYSKNSSSRYSNIKEVEIKENKPENSVDELILYLKKADEIKLFIGNAKNPAYKRLELISKFDILDRLIEKLKCMKKKITVYNY